MELYWEIFGTLCNSCIYNHTIFRTLVYLEPETSSKACRICKVIMHIQGPSIIRTVYSSIFSRMFRHNLGYWCIISDTHRRAIRGRREASPALFENLKKCHGFEKKGPDGVYFWNKFLIQNVILRVSRRKNSKMFFCGASFFLRFWQNIYRGALVSPPPPFSLP